jgi:hypothetical protein
MEKEQKEENKQSKEHSKNKRQSTKAKHEAGTTRKNNDRGGSKGFTKKPRRRPPSWRGPWP